MSDILASIRRTLEADDVSLSDEVYRRERARRAEIEESEAVLRDVEQSVSARAAALKTRLSEAGADPAGWEAANNTAHGAPRTPDDDPHAGGATAPDPAPDPAPDTAAPVSEEAVWSELDRLLSAAQTAFSDRTAHPPRRAAPEPEPRRDPPKQEVPEPTPREPEPKPALETAPPPVAEIPPEAPKPVDPPAIEPPVARPEPEATPPAPKAEPAPPTTPTRGEGPRGPEPPARFELPDSGRRKTVLSKVAAAVKKETVRRLSENAPAKGEPSAEIQALLSGAAPRRHTPRPRHTVDHAAPAVPAETPPAPPRTEIEQRPIDDPSAEAERLEAFDLRPEDALPPSETVLDLTDPVAPGAEATDAPRGQAAQPEGVGERLLSRASEEAASLAFKALADPDGPAARAILARAQVRDQVDTGALDEIAQDTLKPMLSDWLDDNLPDLITRLVREELERTRKG